MTRGKSITRLLSVLAFIACLFCPSPPASADDTRPNVLFISIDDLNDWIGCFGGHAQVQTPNIDALAKRGVAFTNAHCQAPICNPSRVSMFLGKLPSTTGMYFLGPNFRTVDPTKGDETMFQTFRRHGYYLSTRGKIFHGSADKESFDHIEKSTGWRRGDKKINYTLPGSHPLWDWGQVDVPDEEQRDYLTAEWAAAEIPKLASKQQPFFLAVGFHLPHVPIYASKKWFDLYPLESVDLPAMIPSDNEDIPEIATQLTLNPTAPRHKWMVQNQQSRRAVQAYLAANSFVDHMVGMLIEGLEASGEAENTLIVLWSDHGFHMGEKLRWAKRSLWEETTRVPMIFAGPGVVPGARCGKAVGLIDVFPTLLDTCGLPARDDLEGESLRPLLLDANAEWDRPAICTFGPNNHSLRSERYRYIRYSDGSEEFYDLQVDKHEWNNLAVGQKRTAKVEAIIKRLSQWLPTVNVDPVPGSAGSDSPLYGEGTVSLGEAMKRGEKRRAQQKKKATAK
ncbi:MAG: sulfatase [Rubripirellula sp.]